MQEEREREKSVVDCDLLARTFINLCSAFVCVCVCDKGGQYGVTEATLTRKVWPQKGKNEQLSRTETTFQQRKKNKGGQVLLACQVVCKPGTRQEESKRRNLRIAKSEPWREAHGSWKRDLTYYVEKAAGKAHQSAIITLSKICAERGSTPT